MIQSYKVWKLIEGIIQEGIVERVAEVGDNSSKIISIIDENKQNCL